MRAKGFIFAAMAVLWLFIVLLSGDSYAKSQIIVAGDVNFPPIEYLENNVPKGLNMELWQKLSEAMGTKIEIHLMLWKDAQQKVLNGEADALTLLSPTKKRKKFYDFSEPWLEFEFSFFVRSSEVAFHTIKDLGKKVVGVTEGGYARQFLESHKNINFRFIKNTLEGFQLLESNKIAVVATNKWVGSYILYKFDIKGIKLVEKPFTKTATCIPVKKGNLKLLNKINFGIRKLRKDGTIQQILDKWSYKEVIFLTKERIYRTIILVSIAFLVGAVAMSILWIFTLKKQVSDKTKLIQKNNDELIEEIAERNRLEGALLESEELHRITLENLSDAVFLTDNDGAFSYICPNVSFIFGYSLEEVQRFENIAMLLENGLFDRDVLKAHGEIQNIECKIVDKEAKEHILLVNVKQVSIKGGTILYTCRDISELKKAEEELRKSQTQLYQAQKMEALGTLVAGVAHEINNPINLIMFNIPLLQKIWHDFFPILMKHKGEEPDKKYGGLTYDFLGENLNQLLSDMNIASNRVAKIVDDLKNFSRQSNIEDKKPIQINTIVENAIRMAQTTIDKSGIDTKVDLGSNLPLMEGNLQSIEQIFLNLIINASQAIDHDQGKIEIASGFTKKDRRLFFSISDNGRGIDPSISDKIFDPFVTNKQAEGGTGLGLSITYNLVRAHNGEISFQSKKGKGTTFTVFFPTIKKEKRAKILVVDDEDMIREVLTEALTKDHPYLVEEAANGSEACIKLGTYRPDVLILDIFMSEMDGVEVCRAISDTPELSHIKVIIITGFPNDPKLKEVAGMGFSNVYTKPFNPRELVNEVERVLEGAVGNRQ